MAKDYDRSNRDILSLQGEIARTVTEEIRTNLTPEERPVCQSFDLLTPMRTMITFVAAPY